MWKGQHEAIITLDEWKTVQKQRSLNNRPSRRISSTAKRAYVLTGVLKCQCGAPMRGKSIRAGAAGRYVCSRAWYYGKKAANGCDFERTVVVADKVHDAFWPALHALFETPDLVDRLWRETQHAVELAVKTVKPSKAILDVEMEKVERHLSQWYRRHDEAHGDAEQEAAWRRVVELTEQKTQLEKSLANLKLGDVSPTTITREDIVARLRSIASLTKSADPDDLRAYARSLADDHGLSVRLDDGESFTISLALQSPGSGEVAPVTMTAKVPLPIDEIGYWVAGEQGKHHCAVCGKHIEVLRRHRWMGIPKHHQKCRASQLSKKRYYRADGLLTACAAARQLGVSPSSIGRWRLAGKFPEPQKLDNERPLWHKHQLAGWGPPDASP